MRVAPAAAIFLTLVLAACAAPAPAETTQPAASASSASPTPTATAASGPPAATSSAPTEEPEANLPHAGFLLKAVDEDGGLLNLAQTAPVLTFALRELVHDYTCDYPTDPLNGEFVGMRFDVVVDETWADEQMPTAAFTMAYPDFIAYVGDTRVNDPIGNGAGCASSSDSLPTDIRPGTSASGWIVLDLPPDATSVGYAPVIYTETGWEWALDG